METSIKKSSSLTKSEEYKLEVFDLLQSSKEKIKFKEVSLPDLQMKIESISMSFSEPNIYSTASNLIKKLASAAK